MLFSDLFKRFSKSQSVLVEQDSSSLPDHLKRARQAALEFLSIMKSHLAVADGSLHAGTMLSAAAWLTGTSLYRSFRFKGEAVPGTVMQSNEINMTWEGLIYLLEQYNFHKADIPVGHLLLVAMAASDLYQPRVEMLFVQKELESKYNAVMKKHSFGYLDGARVGIMLCSILIQHYCASGTIEAESAAGIVAERILQAAKTTPPPLEH